MSASVTRAMRIATEAGYRPADALTPEGQAALLALPGFGKKCLGILRDIAKTGSANSKPMGRPATMVGGRRVELYLDYQTIEDARRIGNGNLSEGVRFAVRKLNDGL